MTHICVSKLTIIVSDNGLSPNRRQAIIWTNAGILLIGPLGTNFSEILIKILTFSLKKMRLKVSSAKRRPFCLGLNVLTNCGTLAFHCTSLISLIYLECSWNHRTRKMSLFMIIIKILSFSFLFDTSCIKILFWCYKFFIRFFKPLVGLTLENKWNNKWNTQYKIQWWSQTCGVFCFNWNIWCLDMLYIIYP